MSAVIYGGSFDPIHEAHKMIITALSQRFDTVLVVLAKYKKNMMFTDHARCELIEEWLSMTDLKNVELVRDELENEKLSKSYELVMHLKKRIVKELYLCIGYDQYINLKNWYRYEELLKEVKLVVVDRNGKCDDDSVIRLKLRGYSDISSTKIREQIKQLLLLT